jgi:hypothetical protein
MDNYPENSPENIPKPERYRGLSIAALVMGLLGAAAIPQIFRWSSDFRVFDLNTLAAKLIIVFILGIVLPLSGIICGSIDLRRIKSGLYSREGRGFSITAIVLGAVFLIPGLFLFAGEVLFNMSAINDLIFKYEQIPSG